MRLVYEEVAVREDLVHAKETDIFQFLGVGYVVLLGDLIYQYSRQIVLIVVHEYLLLGDRLTGLEVHYMVIVGMCAMRSARIVLEAYRIADDIVLVEGRYHPTTSHSKRTKSPPVSRRISPPQPCNPLPDPYKRPDSRRYISVPPPRGIIAHNSRRNKRRRTVSVDS